MSLAIVVLALNAVILKAQAYQCADIFVLITPSMTALVADNNDRLIEKNLFTTDRGMDKYEELLGRTFAWHARMLSKDDVWVDFGSGRGIALIEYLSGHYVLAEAPTVYGITVSRIPFRDKYAGYEHNKAKDKEWIREQHLKDLEAQFREAGKYISLEGKYVEVQNLPKFTMGTDLYGPFSYTSQLAVVLNKYLEAMTAHESVLYVHHALVDTQFQKGTLIRMPDGRELEVSRWIQTFEGVSLTKGPNIAGMVESFSLIKTKEDFRFPDLELTEMRDATAPAFRVFKYTSN